MKIVRNGCFETNSSSCHSISINGLAIEYDTVLDIHGNGVFCMNLDGYQFGWEIEEYTDPVTKLAYLLTDLKGFIDQDRIADMVKEVFQEHTGLQLLILWPNKDSDYSNYIDHQSSGTAISAIFENGREKELVKDRIKNFIFNKNSVLRTDNDNH